MNKPQWKDAPEWASWLAMDSNGEWYWYALKPDIKYNYFAVSLEFENRKSKRAIVKRDTSNWRESLEHKPAPKPAHQ